MTSVRQVDDTAGEFYKVAPIRREANISISELFLLNMHPFPLKGKVGGECIQARRS